MEVRVARGLADLLNATGMQLISDYAIASEFITNPDVLKILEGHKKLGTGLVAFVERSEEKGLIDE